MNESSKERSANRMSECRGGIEDLCGRGERERQRGREGGGVAENI